MKDSSELQQDITNLSEEALKDLLDQVIDHKRPESEKCPLVRRLNEETMKEEAFLEVSLPTISRALSAGTASSSVSAPTSHHRRKVRGRGTHTQSFNGRPTLSTENQVHSSQSMQDLVAANSNEVSSMAAKGPALSRPGNQRRAATRANSFSHQQERSELTNDRSTSAAAGNCNNSSSLLTPLSQGGQQRKLKSKTANNISVCSSVNKEDPSMFDGNRNSNSDRNNNKSVCDDVDESTSSYESAECSSSLHKAAFRSLAATGQVQNGHRSADDGQDVMQVEMQDLPKKASYQRYSANGSLEANSPTEMTCLLPKNSDHGTGNQVDHGVAFDSYLSKRPSGLDLFDKPNRDKSSSSHLVEYNSDKHEMRQQNEINDSSAMGPRLQAGNQLPSAPSRPELKKKRTKAEEKTLAEQIEGHIGHKDVEYLVNYVTGEGGKDGSKSKEGGVQRAKKTQSAPISQSKLSSRDSRKRNANENEDNSTIPVNSQERSKSVDNEPKMKRVQTISESASASQISKLPSEGLLSSPDEEARDTFGELIVSPPGSPRQAPSESFVSYNSRCDDLTDDEKGYLSDQDSGFQVARTKRHRHLRNRQDYADLQVRRSLPLNKKGLQSYHHHPSSASSPLSTTPSAVSVSSSAAPSISGVTSTSRGYESEREYYTEESRKRQESSRRKVATSMPHSGENSADNSDVDSSLSLPTVRHLSQNQAHGDVAPPLPSPPPSVPPKVSYAAVAKSTSSISGPKDTVVGHLNTKHSGDFIVDSFVGTADEGEEDFPQLISVQLPANEIVEADKVVDVKEEADDSEPEVCSNLDNPLMVESTSHERAASPRSHLKKVNSVPETKAPAADKKQLATSFSLDLDKMPNSSTSLPPVVIFDDEPSLKEATNVSSSFTFGFFDDSPNESTTERNSRSPSASIPEPIKAMDCRVLEKAYCVEPKAEVARPLAGRISAQESGAKIVFKPCPNYDVDLGTFNYLEILNFIYKAWDSALRNNESARMQSIF
ncbi:hypothetical protein HDE_06586 [Halotydeus destructor]|nr:hypothetical protein HDE_06586 [Halotydeus destructor]